MPSTIMWRNDYGGKFIKADPAAVAVEIESIGPDATPAQILEKARDSKTELHKCFEWDDTVAAEKYRIIQARTIVRMLVVVEDKPDPDIPPVRYFFKTSNGEGYKPAPVVFHLQDEYKALLNRAYNELRAFSNKYSRLQELEEVLELIDGLLDGIA